MLLTFLKELSNGASKNPNAWIFRGIPMPHGYLNWENRAKRSRILLGHSKINVTLGTYTHVLEKQKAKATSFIDDIYNTDNILNP